MTKRAPNDPLSGLIVTIRDGMREANYNSYMKVHPRNAGERGAILVLLAVLLAVLLGFVALVIGLGLLSTNKVRLQQFANIASIRALKGYTDSTAATHDEKAQAGLVAANEIVVENRKLPGISGNLGDMGLDTDGSGGKVSYGTWYTEKPSGSDPCGAGYPCYIPYTAGSASPVNASQVHLKTQSGNPLFIPFGSLLNGEHVDVSVDATATVVQQCTVYAMDDSQSVLDATHKFDENLAQYGTLCPGANFQTGACNPALPLEEPAIRINGPYPYSLFAFQHANITYVDTNGVERYRPCNNLFSYDNLDVLIWCNMPNHRSDYDTVPSTYSIDHYKDDYYRIGAPEGNVWMDSFFSGYGGGYYGPQPFSNYMLAFNAGLRAVDKYKSPTDKAALLYFTAGTLGSVPPVDSNGHFPLTESLTSLIDMTDATRRGMFDEAGNAQFTRRAPNFAEAGLFPYLRRDIVFRRSNHAQAIYDALAALSQCPEGSNKSIILATDGVVSCGWNGGTGDCRLDAGEDMYSSHYLTSRAVLLGDIRTRLMRSQVRLLTLLDAESIEPNLIDRQKSDGGWVGVDEAKKLGYCGTSVSGANCDSAHTIVDSSPTVPKGASGYNNLWRAQCLIQYPGAPCDENHYAFMYRNYPGVVFRDPNGLFAQLGLDSGAPPCPIQPQCDASWYNPNGTMKDEFRKPGQTETCALRNISKSQQAVDCIRSVIGTNVFTNVELEPH